jgi:hypothetical protein
MPTYLRSIFGGHQNHPTTTPTPIQTTTRSQTQSSKSHSCLHSVPTVNGATTAYIYPTQSATSTSSYPCSTPKHSQSFAARATAPLPLRYGTLHQPGAGSSGYPVSEDRWYHSRERVLLPCRPSYKISNHGEPYAPRRWNMRALAPTPACSSCLRWTLPGRTQASGCTRKDHLGPIIHGMAAAVTCPQPISTYPFHENTLLTPLSLSLHRSPSKPTRHDPLPPLQLPQHAPPPRPHTPAQPLRAHLL